MGVLYGELLAPPHVPKYPFALARFGLRGLRSARRLAESKFKRKQARALFAGLAAHSAVPLERMATSAFGLVLGMCGYHAAQSALRDSS